MPPSPPCGRPPTSARRPRWPVTNRPALVKTNGSRSQEREPFGFLNHHARLCSSCGAGLEPACEGRHLAGSKPAPQLHNRALPFRGEATDLSLHEALSCPYRISHRATSSGVLLASWRTRRSLAPAAV